MKKGQVTLFILIAIVIVGAITATYFVLSSGRIDVEEYSDIPYYFVAIHSEPLHDIPQVKNSIAERFVTQREIVEKANEYDIKLTLMFSAQVAEYIAEDSGRLEEVKLWGQQGHEISSHHHSIYHSNWDGYTDHTREDTATERITKVREPETYMGTMKDYVDKLKLVNPNVQSGCSNAGIGGKSTPDEIIYDTCSGYFNSGEIGRIEVRGDTFSEKGNNQYILVGTINDIERKWLGHSQITTLQTEGAAETMFLTLDSSSVYGVVTHATQSNDQDVYLFDYLDFLHEQDPTGARSKTVTEVIEQELLSEEEVEF